MLTAPRKPMYYDFISIPGQKLQGSSPAPVINIADGMDDANGPWPDAEAFKLTQVTPDCLEVVWACTVRITDCSPQANLNGIAARPTEPLSTRWEDSVSFDETWKMTYKRVGSAVVSSRSDFSIDSWRRAGNFAPPVLAGFHRKRAEYAISKDGLRCDFMFLDEQMRYSPPYPAVEMDLTQSESYKTVGGVRHGEVSVSLVGVQNANVQLLAEWAHVIMWTRIAAANPGFGPSATVLGEAVMSTRETTTGVVATCTAKYMIPPKEISKGSTTVGTSLWSRILLGAGAGGLGGFAVGGPGGGLVGGIIGGIIGGVTAPDPPPPTTPSGADPTMTPEFTWIGNGTSGGTGPYSFTGFGVWADPSGRVGGPDGGFGYASVLALYANYLSDPCGALIGTANSPTGPTTYDASLSTSPLLGGITGSVSTPSGSTSVTAVIIDAAGSTFAGVVGDSTPGATGLIPSTSASFPYFWDGLAAAYDFWQGVCEFVESPGDIVLPTCNPNGTNIRVNHSSDMLTLKVKWASRRIGFPPRVPGKTLNDPNWVYVGGFVGNHEMQMGADGVSPVWEIRGIYEYQALNPALARKNALIPPYISTQALEGPAAWFTPEVEATGNPVAQTSSGLGQSSSGNLLNSGGSNNPLGETTLPNLLPY